MPDREKVIAQCEWAIKQPSSTIIESKKFYEETLALLKEQKRIENENTLLKMAFAILPEWGKSKQ